ncbi:MAG: hypothetical protein Q7W45_01680 [Bacteroidota bacterium]|nr:hypothetical protein [Bacteroidota bacterium]MDP3146343.1 hypothetical protein [Bacteroidota bacterium]
MFKAKIFQTNVLRLSNEVHIVKEIEGQLVEINPKELKVSFQNGENSIYDLEFLEKDFNTETYIGKFENDIKFRLIRPNDFALENLKKEYECVSAFSIASINPDGYAIHFLMLNINNDIGIDVVEKGDNEQLKRLISGSIMAIQVGLHQNFIDYTKRILNMIFDINYLLEFENGGNLIQIMRQNINLYSSDEKRKIMRSA